VPTFEAFAECTSGWMKAPSSNDDWTIRLDPHESLGAASTGFRSVAEFGRVEKADGKGAFERTFLARETGRIGPLSDTGIVLRFAFQPRSRRKQRSWQPAAG
jgi:hypothetical protein